MMHNPDFQRSGPAMATTRETTMCTTPKQAQSHLWSRAPMPKYPPAPRPTPANEARRIGQRMVVEVTLARLTGPSDLAAISTPHPRINVGNV